RRCLYLCLPGSPETPVEIAARRLRIRFPTAIHQAIPDRSTPSPTMDRTSPESCRTLPRSRRSPAPELLRRVSSPRASDHRSVATFHLQALGPAAHRRIRLLREFLSARPAVLSDAFASSSGLASTPTPSLAAAL